MGSIDGLSRNTHKSGARAGGRKSASPSYPGCSPPGARLQRTSTIDACPVFLSPAFGNSPFFSLGDSLQHSVNGLPIFPEQSQRPDTLVPSRWEHQPEGSLWPQKHAQSPCLEQAGGAGALMSPEAALKQRGIVH